MMTSNFQATRALAIAALAAGSLAACAPAPARWSTAESPRNIVVDHVQMAHQVLFAPGQTKIEASEQARLEEFLDRTKVGYGDQVYVTGTTRQGEAVTLAGARQAMVAGYLADRRLAPLALPPTPGSQQSNGAATVVVARAVAIPPACPDWSRPPPSDLDNSPMGNFGCANAVNLGLMIADPNELIAGRGLGPADGTYAADAIRRYRGEDAAPKVKPYQGDPQVPLPWDPTYTTRTGGGK